MKLGNRQAAALQLMLQGIPNAQISTRLGIDRKTLYNWRHRDPDFQAALSLLRAHLTDLEVQRLLPIVNSALNTLDHQLTSMDSKTAHRAARTILVLSKLGQHLYEQSTAPLPPPFALPEPQSPSAQTPS